MSEAVYDKQEMHDTESGAATGTEATGALGLERWVQFAFIMLALVLLWLLDHAITGIWNIFDDPDETMVTAAAAVCAMAVSWSLYRKAHVRAWADEVASELSKSHWPARQETWSATVVVLFASVVAALILLVLDKLWSSLSDYIYAFKF
ncbi:MAG: preprotein translocase subunit SecE [Polyangiales bacterium]